MRRRLAITAAVLMLSAGCSAGKLEDVARRHFSAEERARGESCSRRRLACFLFDVAMRLAVLALLAGRFSPLLERLHGKVAEGGWARMLAADACVAAAVAAAYALAGLPTALIHWAIVGRAFDLTRLSFFRLLGRWAAGAGIVVLLGVLLGTGIAASARVLGRWWGPVFWAGGSVVAGLLVLLWPVVVDPLFSRFRPVEEEVAREIHSLARAAGMEAKAVYWSDASTRTTAANAYFTGLGPTRRVVLYDTLPKETPLLLSVVGHELGHWKKGHVWKGLLLSFLAAGLFFLTAPRLFGLESSPALSARVAALAFAFFLVSLPLSNVISRRFERQADRFALEVTGDPGAFIALECALVVKNCGDPTPNRVAHFFLHTHPSPAERILAAEEFE